MTGYLVIRAGGEPVGFRIEDVVEVLDRGDVTPALGTHAAVLGVTRVRREHVPLVDLATLLGREPPADTPQATVVLVRCGGRRVAFQVEEADAVLREAPEPLPGGWRLPWASSVARSSEGLIPIVDMAVLAERLTSVAGERV